MFRGNIENELTSFVNDDVTGVSLPNYDTFEVQGYIYFPKYPGEFDVHGTVHLSNTSHINTNEMQLFFFLLLFYYLKNKFK